MVDGKGGAEGKSTVAGGWLDINALEGRALENFSIGDAIEGDATREAESFCLRLRVEGIHVRKKDVFEMRLHARGKILVALFEWLFGRARAAKLLFQERGKQASEHRCLAGLSPCHLRPAPVMSEIAEIQAEADGLLGAPDSSKFAKICGRAVRGEPHHLVFIAEFQKSEILRHRRIKHSQRMGKGDRAGDANPRSLAHAPHRAREIAQAVRGEHGGAVEGRNEKRAG